MSNRLAPLHLELNETTATRRARERRITAAQLWARAASAVNAELSADRYTAEQREDVTAHVVERTLRAVAGEAKPPRAVPRPRPRDGESVCARAVRYCERIDYQRAAELWRDGIARADSPRVTWQRLARIAKDKRESIDAAAAHLRELTAGHEETLPSLQVIGTRGQELAEEDVQLVADRFTRALDLPDLPRWQVLAWSFARDLPDGNSQRGVLSPVDVAKELQLTPAAYRQNLKRAQDSFAKLYPDPSEVAARLTGQLPMRRLARLDHDRQLVETLLWGAPADAPWPREIRRELDSKPHPVAHDWPEGTAPVRVGERLTGERVKRPADLRAARARCKVSALAVADGGTGRIDRRRRKARPAEVVRAARRNIARAYRAEAIHRDGTRKERVAAVDPRKLNPQPARKD